MLPAGVELTEQELIPCLCLNDYIGIPFPDYPSKAKPNYQIPSDEHSAWFRAGPMSFGLPAFQSFLQTWLFFGLLQEVLSTSFRHEDFVREIPDGSRSRSVLSTAKLRDLLDKWTESATDDQNFDLTRVEYLRRCFKVTYLALAAAPTNFSVDLKFAIASVTEAVMETVQRTCKLKEMDSVFSETIPWMIFDDPKARSEQFKRSGWCQAQAARALKHNEACQCAHFLSHLGKNQIENGHAKCEPEKCVGCQIDPDTYSPLHFAAHCTSSCEELRIEHDVLLKILDGGESAIVLLDLDWNKHSDEITVTPIPSGPDSFYIALSHVWADGLGNTRSNAVPRCQLRRLFDLLTPLSREPTSSKDQTRPYLWLDTLCCPTEPEAKKIAMARMHQTYLEAAHVLVLESSLANTRHLPLSPLEVFARICTSAWMYRAWTLQEAFLAKKLRVQFSDGAVELGQLIDLVITANGPASSLNIVLPLVHKAIELRFVPDKHDSGDLFNLATALKHRDLSQAEDEPLCIAAFLGLNFGEIAEKPTGRMEHLWSSIDRTRKMISRNIIFYVGPRLTTPGYRWAPRTMLHINDQSPFYLSSETPRADVTRQGLLLSCAAVPIWAVTRVDRILTRSTLAALDSVDLLRDEANHWYTATSTAAQRDYATDLGRPKTSARGEGSLYEIVTLNKSDFEVLIQQTPDQEQSELKCLLVQVTQVRGQDLKRVHACRQFSLQSLDPATSDLLNCVFVQAQAMQQAEISLEITKTAQEGAKSPAYRSAMVRFLGEVNLFVDQVMEYSYVNIPNSQLGLNEYPRDALFALLSRFYRNRHLLINMGKVYGDAQLYCID